MELGDIRQSRLPDTLAGKGILGQWPMKLAQHFELPDDFKEEILGPLLGHFSVDSRATLHGLP
eukprot:CAMPEP_0113676316 /NCGR_PEP_ID=MMETSP0038_2-20120614/8570_1 /TAXON_ID=2898 /ORGANISM="Cryptomonas paramecium" /LENGTH=62 /DNA_ID=CAMNT_0000593321 /DNA_START=162 /DNA_END=346 /DNA_ORIENTATION=+ /assembly_acc=CAM_ASM_000170